MKKLDDIDFQILASLYRNARLTNKELADSVGLAASSCLERVRRLQKDGVIQSHNTTVNFKALGGHLEAIVAVRLATHSKKIVEAFRDSLSDYSEVINIFHMGGENDFLVHVTVYDTEHLRDFVYNAFTSNTQVVHVESSLVYEHMIGQKLPQFSDK